MEVARVHCVIWPDVCHPYQRLLFRAVILLSATPSARRWRLRWLRRNEGKTSHRCPKGQDESNWYYARPDIIAAVKPIAEFSVDIVGAGIPKREGRGFGLH